MAMTKRERQAQEYLAIRDENGEKKIVNIKRLLKRHSTAEMVQFLSDLYSEQEKELKILVEEDKSNHEIDAVVSRMFRLHMAIALLKKEEVTGTRAA